MEINLFTGKFVRFEVNDDGEEKVVIDVRLNEDVVQRRIFDAILVANIKNPKNLIFGIKTEPGRLQINFMNGNRYYKLFKQCGWK